MYFLLYSLPVSAINIINILLFDCVRILLLLLLYFKTQWEVVYQNKKKDLVIVSTRQISYYFTDGIIIDLPIINTDTRPQLQTSGEKRSWTPKEKMATRRCWNRSNDLIHGG